MTTRRQFLRSVAGLGTASLVPTLGWAAAGSPAFLAAAKLADESFCLVGLTELGAETFRIAIPDRGHAAAAHPDRPEAVAFARRPGTFALVIDCAEGRVVARLTAPVGRHLYGHGAFTADGRPRYTTENAIGVGVGRRGVGAAADGYRRMGEVSSGGVGPHEVLRIPDGRRLAVANGGILTDPGSGRAKLNLDTMRPNLAYLDAATGALLDMLEPPETLRPNSIRHIAAGPDGTVAAALQWEGPPLEMPPLLALHRPGGADLAFLSAPPVIQRRTRNYAGSVAVSADGGRAAITAPRGGLMLAFALDGSDAVEVLEETDVCGVARSGDGFTCTTSAGAFVAPTGAPVAHDELAFDNHLVRI
jgi:hypothetical protein